MVIFSLTIFVLNFIQQTKGKITTFLNDHIIPSYKNIGTRDTSPGIGSVPNFPV